MSPKNLSPSAKAPPKRPLSVASRHPDTRGPPSEQCLRNFERIRVALLPSSVPVQGLRGFCFVSVGSKRERTGHLRVSGLRVSCPSFGSGQLWPPFRHVGAAHSLTRVASGFRVYCGLKARASKSMVATPRPSPDGPCISRALRVEVRPKLELT